MRWRVKPKPMEYPDLKVWHQIFLWQPKVIGEYKYWLEYVWQRAIFNGLPQSGLDYEYSYALSYPDKVEWEYSIDEPPGNTWPF